MGESHEIMDVFLQPGEFYVGGADTRIRTLLGSCVSITLWHRRHRVGAMSHFLLAERRGEDIFELDGRYGEEAMWLLLRELVRADVSPTECEAKIFGGANMFPDHHAAIRMNIGRKNGTAARRLLQGYRIPVVSESLFGVGHRQIIFNIATGDVWSRQTRPVQTFTDVAGAAA